MAKWIKNLLGLAAIVGAIAGLVYFLKKKSRCGEDDEFEDDFEDEDFDLDNDLKPVSDREYVPLNAAGKTEEDQEAETPVKKPDADTSEK